MSTKRVGAATVILNEQGQVLLVKHNYGKFNWEIPGGLSESNESAKETASREIKEETGLSVEIGQLTCVYYELKYDMHHFCFLASYNNESLPVADNEEVTECRFFNVDDLPRPMSDFTINRIKDALNNSSSVFKTISDRVWFE